MIQIQKLNKTYDRRRAGENHVLRDVTLSLPDTGFVCILGPSGCGKTSLLNAIGGLDEFDNGTVCVDEVTADRYGTTAFEEKRNRSFGYIFQNYYLLSEHSVGYNVYLGLHSLKLSHSEKLQRVREALKAVEMERYIRRNISELSGGQQQRVAIARALARNPRVIFADEPTGNLDEANTINICSLLRSISKSSLVIMVTHEERIARFFADRIISLENGCINYDCDSWERSGLTVGSAKAFYTGDYRSTSMEDEQVQIRVLQEENTPPITLSVVVLKDRIIIKSDDHRAISCSATHESPELIEGRRPVLILEEVDRQGIESTFLQSEDISSQSEPGQGLTFPDMFREAGYLSKKKSLRGLGARLFLVLLSVLLALSVADILSVMTHDPEDFITTHSQALEVVIERGPRAGSSTETHRANARAYKARIANTQIPHISAPDISYSATVSGNPILQASGLRVTLKDCSYVPVSYFDPAALIHGHAPEDPFQVVVDRWVLDAVLKEEGVAQNSIPDITYFLGKTIQFGKLKAAPKIVGICDSGEPAVYISDEMLASIGTSGTEAIGLSTFQKLYPGAYDDVVLTENSCIVIPANAGEIFLEDVNKEFRTVCGSTFAIAAVSPVEDCYAKIVVADSQIPALMENMSLGSFWVYCEDKTAMTEHLLKTAKRQSDVLSVSVIDHYAQTMAQYKEASQLHTDARLVVTVTVVLICAVMLYLLRRTDVQSRIGMLSVYRLLGIPRNKTVGIFQIETVRNTVSTAVPAIAAVWAVIAFLRHRGLTELVFPAAAAVAVVMAILAFQVFVTAIPLRKLLKLPPAQLASKYDY